MSTEVAITLNNVVLNYALNINAAILKMLYATKMTSAAPVFAARKEDVKSIQVSDGFISWPCVYILLLLDINMVSILNILITVEDSFFSKNNTMCRYKKHIYKKKYTSLKEARTACLNDENCVYFYDTFCLGKKFKVCTKDAKYRTSKKGSCMHVHEGREQGECTCRIFSLK